MSECVANWNQQVMSQPSRLNVQRFRGGLVVKAHRLLYHSTLGLRVIKKKKRRSGETAETELGDEMSECVANWSQQVKSSSRSVK